MLKTGFELLTFANAINYMRPSIWYNMPTQGLQGGIIGLKGLAAPGQFTSLWNPVISGAGHLPGAMGKFARDFAKKGLAGQPGTWGEVGKFLGGTATIGKFTFPALGREAPKLAAMLQKTSLRQLYNIGYSNMGNAEAALFYQRFATPIRGLGFTMGAGGKIIPQIRAAAKWATFGKVAGGLLTGANAVMWGLIIGKLAYSTMKGIGSAAGAFQRIMPEMIRNIRALEFGSGYAPQFQTSMALTERQRAINEIQRHNLNARRFLGNEASLSPNMY